MLSRVAENIYWMARYIERAENTARLIAVNANLLMDLPKGISPGWQPLIAITGGEENFLKHYKDFTERSVLHYLIDAKENSGSLLSSLRAARENCRTIRDIVPREGWEQINELYLQAQENLASGLTKKGRHAYLRTIILHSQTITGLLAGTMNHDEGYQFLRIGRNLERADMTTRIIDVRSGSLLENAPLELRPFDNIQWVSVLKSLTAYQMYRRSMQAQVRRDDVLSFLMQHPEFPRSVLHSLVSVTESLHILDERNEGALRVTARLQRQLQQLEPARLRQEDLHRIIDDIQKDLMELHSELVAIYFEHSREEWNAPTSGDRGQAQVAATATSNA